MLIACYMVYRALDIKNSNFSKIKCFVVIILAIQNLIEYLNRNYIVFGIGIAILIIAYCVFYIGDGNILIFEKLFSKLSNKTQYILLGVYVLFLLITVILSFVN